MEKLTYCHLRGIFSQPFISKWGYLIEKHVFVKIRGFILFNKAVVPLWEGLLAVVAMFLEWLFCSTVSQPLFPIREFLESTPGLKEKERVVFFVLRGYWINYFKTIQKRLIIAYVHICLGKYISSPGDWFTLQWNSINEALLLFIVSYRAKH